MRCAGANWVAATITRDDPPAAVAAIVVAATAVMLELVEIDISAIADDGKRVTGKADDDASAV